MRNPRPRWGLLYALIPLAAVLLVAAHLVAPSDGWRQLAEGVVSLVVIGAMASWVRVNRLALMLGDEHQKAEKVEDTQGVQAQLDELDGVSRR